MSDAAEVTSLDVAIEVEATEQTLIGLLHEALTDQVAETKSGFTRMEVLGQSAQRDFRMFAFLMLLILGGVLGLRTDASLPGFDVSITPEAEAATLEVSLDE